MYHFIITTLLAISSFIFSPNAEANRQFNKVKVKGDNELNVNYKALIKKYSKELKVYKNNKKILIINCTNLRNINYLFTSMLELKYFY